MAINREEKAVVLIVWGGCHNWVSERFGALWMFVLFRLRQCLPRMEMKDMTLWQMLVCCDRKLYHCGTFWRCVLTTDFEEKSVKALLTIWSILDMDHTDFHDVLLEGSTANCELFVVIIQFCDLIKEKKFCKYFYFRFKRITYVGLKFKWLLHRKINTFVFRHNFQNESSMISKIRHLWWL